MYNNVRHYINIQMLAVSELCQDIIFCPAWSLPATLFVTTPRSTPAIDWAGDQCSVQTDTMGTTNNLSPAKQFCTD